MHRSNRFLRGSMDDLRGARATVCLGSDEAQIGVERFLYPASGNSRKPGRTLWIAFIMDTTRLQALTPVAFQQKSLSEAQGRRAHSRAEKRMNCWAVGPHWYAAWPEGHTTLASWRRTSFDCTAPTSVVLSVFTMWQGFCNGLFRTPSPQTMVGCCIPRDKSPNHLNGMFLLQRLYGKHGCYLYASPPRLSIRQA
jgi:hypothetical protein